MTPTGPAIARDLDRCGKCPVDDGTCYPRRVGLRRLCEVPAYHASIAAWGARGGPGGGPEPVGLSEWHDLPEAAREAARACGSRRAEKSVAGCGCEVLMCRGGVRDGQVVGLLDCGRCKALAAGAA